MAKRTPLECSPENCGDLFLFCGTRNCYERKSCRCAACVAVRRNRARAKRANIHTGPTGECSPENCKDLYASCGSVSTYTNLKCRCDSCRAASTARSREARRRRAIGARVECSPENCGDLYRQCGTATAFQNWKCRCTSCRAFKRADSSARIAKLKQINHGQCSAIKCGSLFPECGLVKTYKHKKCRCDACIEACRLALRLRYADNPDQFKAASHRRRAKVSGVLNISYTQDQLVQKYKYWGDRCYLRGPDCAGAADVIEHVIPIERGGPNVLANIRPACKTCNSAKWAHWPYPIPYRPGGATRQ